MQKQQMTPGMRILRVVLIFGLLFLLVPIGVIVLGYFGFLSGRKAEKTVSDDAQRIHQLFPGLGFFSRTHWEENTRRRTGSFVFPFLHAVEGYIWFNEEEAAHLTQSFDWEAVPTDQHDPWRPSFKKELLPDTRQEWYRNIGPLSLLNAQGFHGDIYYEKNLRVIYFALVKR